MIPALIFRTVPAQVDERAEQFWMRACDLHLGWRHITYRDPLDPLAFPLTAAYWSHCHSGAQLAGLVRLEALWHHGGVYIDSDVQVIRSLEPFRRDHCFAAWEDDSVVPDAVLGAMRHHPAIEACLDLAIERICSHSHDWRTGNGAWSTGPGVTTAVLPFADGVTLYPPSAFYPVHYSEKDRLADYEPGPDTFAVHHWVGSWLA